MLQSVLETCNKSLEKEVNTSTYHAELLELWELDLEVGMDTLVFCI